MSWKTLPDLKYTESDEWVRIEGDSVTIGITDYAQDQLNDVVFVELPRVGDKLQKGANFGVVESVKAASDLVMPVSGELVAGTMRWRRSPTWRTATRLAGLG